MAIETICMWSLAPSSAKSISQGHIVLGHTMNTEQFFSAFCFCSTLHSLMQLETHIKEELPDINSFMMQLSGGASI